MRAEHRRFRRVIEDFTCFNCKTKVKGTGYTDHCPKCLWSIHVDSNPGDRASGCGGRMEPIGTEYRNGGYVISYLCVKCGAHKHFKASEKDDAELLMSLVKATL